MQPDRLSTCYYALLPSTYTVKPIKLSLFSDNHDLADRPRAPLAISADPMTYMGISIPWVWILPRPGYGPTYPRLRRTSHRQPNSR